MNVMYIISFANEIVVCRSIYPIGKCLHLSFLLELKNETKVNCLFY